MRILVVDDDASIRESLKRVLEAAHYEVALAADGEQAIERFAATPVDLLVLDLNLPVKSGWDAFEEMTRRNPWIPIVVITGLSNRYDAALAAGVGALLEKPIEVPALLKIIDELLAEPKENRLRRLCGRLPDTRYVPGARSPVLQRLRERAAARYRPKLPRTRRKETES